MKAKVSGIPICVANDERLAAMWTQVVNLIKIQITTDEEESQFDNDLLDLNDWVRRQYGSEGITCEDVELAYNWLVMERLHKADSRVLEAYPRLDARHIGEVLAAYQRQVDNDMEVHRIIANQLYLPPPPEYVPTPQEIDAFMERTLKKAIQQAKAGIAYVEPGNGLYAWLYQQGRLRPTDRKWNEYLEIAQQQVRLAMVGQRVAEAPVTPDDFIRGGLGKSVASLLKNELTGDFKQRVRQTAMRLCLIDFLREQAGLPLNASLTPDLPVSEPPPAPIRHDQYIDWLTTNLPKFKDEQVSDLQRQAKDRNVLDVYQLTSAEWSRRHPSGEKLKTI